MPDDVKGLSRREVLGAAAAAISVTAAGPIGKSQPSVQLDKLVELATDRPRALRDGSMPYVTHEIQRARLPINSHEGTQDVAARSAALARQARSLRSTNLSPAEQDTLETLIWDLDCDVELARFYWHQFPLGYSASQLSSLNFGFLAPPPAAEASEFLERVRQAPAYVDGIRERLKGQIQRGLTAPRAEGVRAFDQFQVEAKEVEASIRKCADAVHSPAIKREVAQILSGALAVAFTRLSDTIKDEYIPALNEQAKMTRSPDANEFFRAMTKVRTSDAIDLQTAHEAAQATVAAIDAELAQIRKQIGGSSDADAFYRSMAGNPRWYVRSAAELKARLEATIAQVSPLVPPYFHAIPKTPFGVEELPAALQTRLLNGFYRPPSAELPKGTYLYNSSRLDVSNWGWVKPLVSHELMPGHHLQAALRFVATDLSPYRKETFISGYAEGWGEYARVLMEEAGLYRDDPWGLYACRLSQRRFALRTAVETGVRRPDWTWQAADAQLATDPFTRPGTTQQIALAAATFRSTGLPYWWGVRRFLALRELAKKQSRHQFDIRDFHASVVRGDLVPFAVAERRVTRLRLT